MNDDEWAIPANASSFGQWSTDDSGLPCFDLNLSNAPEPDAPLEHLMSTGVVTARIDRWGDLRLMTCAGGDGQKSLRPSRWWCLSDLLLSLEINGTPYSLLPGQGEQERVVRWGVGYAHFTDRFVTADFSIEVSQLFTAPWDDSTGIVGSFQLRNIGNRPMVGRVRLMAQVASVDNQIADRSALPFQAGPGWITADAAHQSLGQAVLLGPDAWQPKREFATLVLTHPTEIALNSEFTFQGWVGCTPKNLNPDIPALRRQLSAFDPADHRRKWAARLSPTKLPAPAAWIRQECQWTAGQLLAFTGYDGSVGNKFIHLGGYGWPSFGVRECAETAIAIVEWMPELATDSIYWLAKHQFRSGDLPKCTHFTGRANPTATPVESDNEIWFLLALSELLATGIPHSILKTRLPFTDGTSGTLWEHAKAAWHWLRDSIQVGRHGLVKIWHGDWDDYMDRMGRHGQGESTMNTGMACRAIDGMIAIAGQRGEADLASELTHWVNARRDAMMSAFDQTHFVRGFNDAGQPVGTAAEGRVHLNAQTWAVLGSCGTPQMRRLALTTACCECDSPIGLTLLSKPFPAPPPADISSCPIPPGEGENAGIWPQTVHWAIWALAQEGMLDEARQVWRAVSLRNHAHRHPQVPYGIWNGPDCYSAHFAKQREGRTQRQILDRHQEGVPMNPAVAWQAFSWRKILRAVR
jgi:Glycosyl hydrolase 36 superfamily, catalytic domain